jgi:hypothetical protein
MKLELVERISGRELITQPKVSISPKGTFYVNSKASKLMGITDHALVSIFKDEDDNQKWFIKIGEGGYIKLRLKDVNKDMSAQMTMTDIAKKIINSFYHEGTKSLKFKLLEAVEYEGDKYYPLQVIKESIEMNIPNPNGKPK